MKIGFTGTRKGMSAEQMISVESLLKRLNQKIEPIKEAHHGMCIGSDANFNVLVRLHSEKTCLVAHPAFPEGHELRAKSKCHIVLPVKEIWVRNREIVQWGDLLIATPFEMEPQFKGGTWGTIKIAKQHGKKVCVVWRDGKLGWWTPKETI